ncbi:hypothetical protein [Spiroplasma floricola]|uniref:Lipoprotein n=1 Tax=Spiroplasma floricola 23-6 TaxID=1336749 RepID=A0A2K8SDK3_9MOLU|nr:hypothetical protein [Spiroplasma floricola]AUB31544.1 hypothetical protein SFLOR_v1c04920 [Spiroplasma floricola 23-6]
MKKILSIFSSIFIIPLASALSVSCEAIVTIASKSYKGKTDEINIFFNGKNIIKPYNLKYLEFINDSWEHFGFESSLSSNKIENNLILVTTDEEKNFINVLSEIYKPLVIATDLYDFTGMTIIVENIFLNSINVKRVNENDYSTTIESELALTIKKGWKEQGKILASLSNSTPLDKAETFLFINKIINGIELNLKVSDNMVKDEKTNEKYYEIQGSLSETQQAQFTSKLISRANAKLSLDLTDKITFDDKQNTLQIDGINYKFVEKSNV